MSSPKKVVLAYSGGLDTSIILKWLQEEKGCEVVTFTADLGQGEELEPARRKAEAAGVKEIFIDDLREEFVRDFVFPMFRANALYEGLYLLGTSIARPLISKRQIEIAHQVGADAVCHGATGKGNDQVRFELGYYALDPTILTKLNELGGANGIGRLDLLENRYVGMKSRGVYETPGGTILLMAHRGIEQITMDKGASHLKDELMPKYAELVYNGYWYSPEREMLQAAIDKSQELVTGTVRLKLYKGNVDIVGRKSEYSLYSQEHVTFEEDDVYDQADAGGFIKINALRLRLLKARDRKAGKNT